MNTITESKTEIDELCRRNGVRELYVFGSATRDDFSALSDIDFLVEFDWSKNVSFSDSYWSLKIGLENLFNRSVDLVCYSAIRNPFFRKQVEETKEVVYAP